MIMEQYEKAYEEADRFEKMIKELLEKYPLKENKFFWVKFTRTVGTSLRILNETSMENK
jgi:hypothetical protein